MPFHTSRLKLSRASAGISSLRLAQNPKALSARTLNPCAPGSRLLAGFAFAPQQPPGQHEQRDDKVSRRPSSRLRVGGLGLGVNVSGKPRRLEPERLGVLSRQFIPGALLWTGDTSRLR